MNEHSPSFELLSSHFQSRPFRIVAPIPILSNGCVFQMVPLGLEHPYFGRRDRGRRIRMAGTLILAIPITLERLPISIECKPTLHHLLVLRVLGSLEITHRTLAAVLCDAEDPCSVNTAHEPESSFTVSPRCTSRPLYVWNFLSNL